MEDLNDDHFFALRMVYRLDGGLAWYASYELSIPTARSPDLRGEEKKRFCVEVFDGNDPRHHWLVLLLLQEVERQNHCRYMFLSSSAWNQAVSFNKIYRYFIGAVSWSRLVE